ncbi:amidohydrolase family protein [Rhodococcus koreensis]
MDIHHTWKSVDEMLSYLPQRWQDYARGDGRMRAALAPPSSHVFTLLDAVGSRLDSMPEVGPPGSDHEMLRDQLFDRYTSDYRGVMTFNIGAEAGHNNPYLSAALCTAANDWNIERWLPRDSRYYGCLLLPSNNIEAAVAEIHRVGNHPRMVGVLFPINPMGRPFGDPLFHPIYEAALEYDLSLDLHVNSADSVSVRSGVGTPGSYVEHSIRLSDPAMHYLSSFIVNGVFEKFPDLKVLVKEYGTTWLPHMIWKLDQSYDVLRMESPWVKKRPWEYIHSNIKFSTQPLEVSKDAESKWVDLMTTIDGIEDVLCFSSDYPHYQFDHPLEIARMLPDTWVEKIMYKNSCDLFGWPVPEAGTTPVTEKV